MYRLMTIEKGLVFTFSMLLFLLNILSVYFSIDFISYDATKYPLENLMIKDSNNRSLGFLYFTTGLLNIFFITVFLIHKRLINNNDYDG